MSFFQQYPLVIAGFKITKHTMEERSLLTYHKSQLMDQHLITTVQGMEEDSILAIQPLHLTAQHLATIVQVIMEE